MAFLKWFARRALFLAFAVSLVFTIVGVKFYGASLKHDWIMRHGEAQQGMLQVWRGSRRCMATLNYQLEQGNAPRVDVYASPALCGALAGKPEGPVAIHFLPRGPFKGAVVLDDEFRAEPTLLGPFPRRTWPWLFALWFLAPMISVGLPLAVKRGSKRSPAFKRLVAFLTAQR